MLYITNKMKIGLNNY